MNEPVESKAEVMERLRSARERLASMGVKGLGRSTEACTPTKGNGEGQNRERENTRQKGVNSQPVRQLWLPLVVKGSGDDSRTLVERATYVPTGTRYVLVVGQPHHACVDQTGHIQFK